MSGLDADEIAAYWEETDRRFPVDRTTDPLGLRNACRRDAPVLYTLFFDRLQRAAFDRMLSGLDADRALDVGCGTGRWSYRLACRGTAVTGIDIQPGAIKETRAFLPAGQFDVGDARDLPYARNRFDLAVAVETLQHLPVHDRPDAFAELDRVLAPGGHLILIERAAPSPHPHVHPFTPDEWALLRARFELLRDRPVVATPIHRWAERAVTRHPSPSSPEDLARRTGSSWFYRAAIPLLAASLPCEPVLSRVLPGRAGSYRAVLYRAPD